MNVVPTIVALRKKFDEIRKNELEKTLSQLNSKLPPGGKEALDAMTNAIINKIIHKPITLLKQSNSEDGTDSELYIDTLMKMFDLKEYMENSENEEEVSDRDEG